MKRMFALAMMVALLAALVVPVTALATHYNYWHNYGGFPLVPGGVHSATQAANLELNNNHVRKAIRLVIKTNHQPSWLMAAFDKEAEAGDVHRNRLRRGTKVGAMSYGHPRAYVENNTVWHGKPYWLYNRTMDAQKTYTVTINGRQYLKTVRYRLYMAEKCTNVFVRRLPNVLTPLYRVFAEKRMDSVTGPRIVREIHGKIGSKSYSLQTKTTGRVLIGWLKAGTKLSAIESLNASDTPVSPLSGRFDITVPKYDKTLTFVNRLIYSPPPPVCPVYRIDVQKTLDSASGTRIADWVIQGTVTDPMGVWEFYSVLTRADGPVNVGSFPAGRTYDFSELAQAGYEIVSPLGGRFTGTMPDHDIVLTFVNRRIITPPPPTVHQIIIVGSFEQTSCMIAGSFTGTLTVDTVVNTGDRIVHYTWTIDGNPPFTTTDPFFVPLFTFNVEHHVSVVALAEDGHTASANFPPIREEGPGTPLGPLGD